MKYTSGRMNVNHRDLPASDHHTELVAHGGIRKIMRGRHSQHHLVKPSLTTSGPEFHKRESNKDPADEPPNGVRVMRMFKRGLRYANKDANSSDLIEAAMVFMGTSGKEMTNLELLKREEQNILAWQMMRHHQQNYFRGSSLGAVTGPLPKICRTVPSRDQNPPVAAGTLEKLH